MQEWLAKHGPFNAILDGANVACYGSSGNFYFSKIASTLRLLAHTHPHLRPLVVRPSLASGCGDPAARYIPKSWCLTTPAHHPCSHAMCASPAACPQHAGAALAQGACKLCPFSCGTWTGGKSSFRWS